MLEDLTTEQEGLIDSIAEEYISDANCGDPLIDQRQAAATITKIYALADQKPPQIVFVSGPMDARDFCKQELKQDIKDFDYFGLGFDSGWVSFYDYFQRIGVLERDDEEFNTVKSFMKSGVWATIMFENIVICIARPNRVCVDERGNLHSDSGPAIAFDDGYEEFAWHGSWVTEKIIMRPEMITRKDIEEEKNSEVSRAMAERLGWDEYMKRAECVLVDKWFDTEKSNHYELWDFKKRFALTPRLLKMESPELNDGTRPYYVEPVPPQAKTCQAARRWQVDPSRPEIDECNRSPEIVFQIEA